MTWFLLYEPDSSVWIVHKEQYLVKKASYTNTRL